LMIGPGRQVVDDPGAPCPASKPATHRHPRPTHGRRGPTSSRWGAEVWPTFRGESLVRNPVRAPPGSWERVDRWLPGERTLAGVWLRCRLAGARLPAGLLLGQQLTEPGCLLGAEDHALQRRSVVSVEAQPKATEVVHEGLKALVADGIEPAVLVGLDWSHHGPSIVQPGRRRPQAQGSVATASSSSYRFLGAGSTSERSRRPRRLG
jgi:hypothetical protein